MTSDGLLMAEVVKLSPVNPNTVKPEQDHKMPSALLTAKQQALQHKATVPSVPSPVPPILPVSQHPNSARKNNKPDARVIFRFIFI